MKKKTSYANYQRMRQEAEQKGWSIQAYEIGFYQEGTKKPVI